MEKEHTQEILRGHIDECLENLNHKFEGKKNTANKQILIGFMASFCDVKIDSCRRWMHGTKNLPISDKKIKLMCFLSMLNYKIIELENMSESFRGLTELIAFKVISLNEATSLVGYKEQSNLIRVLYGQENPSPEKKKKIWDIWTSHKSKLNEVKAHNISSIPKQILKVLNSSQETETDINQPVIKEDEPGTQKEILSKKDYAEKVALCRANFNLISALLKFLKLPSFANLKPEELFPLLSDYDIKNLCQLSEELEQLKNKCLAKE